MRKTAVKTAGIIMILCLVLWYANHVLSIKDDDGIYSMKKFYELDKNTVDVLVVGSSHAYSSCRALRSLCGIPIIVSGKRLKRRRPN